MKNKFIDPYIYSSCADPGSNVGRGGGGPTSIFNVDEGRKDPNTTISGPYSAASEIPFKWHFAVVPMMAQHLMLALQLCDFQGIETSIAK